MQKLEDVKLFLLDMDGTVYLSDKLLDGAREFFSIMGSRGVDHMFVTNNCTKDRFDYVQKLQGLGMAVRPEQIMTSGEATVIYMQTHFPEAKLFVCGTPSLEQEFVRGGFALEWERPDAVVIGFDTTFDYAKMWKLCDHVRAGLPYVATHPDLNCPLKDGAYMPDIGCIMAYVETSTGRRPQAIIGKPNAALVEAAGLKYGVDPSQMAMVGDRLYTDVAMANNAGILGVLVLSGESTLEDVRSGGVRPDYIFENIGAMARYCLHPKEESPLNLGE